VRHVPNAADTAHLPPSALRALVVEDNAGDRWFYSELLRARGYHVLSCETGEAAWDAFLADPPPLVLVDLMLPGIDGVELCRRIRTHPGGSEPVVLAVTGHDDHDSLTGILDAGADDFLRKPVPPALFGVRMQIAEQRIRDRMERLGAKAELQFKTWELEQLFRNVPDVFFSVDLTAGRLIQISPAAEGLFGRAVVDIQRDPSLWRGLLFPTDGSLAPWDPGGVAHPGLRVVRDYPVERPDGTGVWVRTSLSVERDPRTRHLRADGFVSDVTEEWAAHATLALRNRELAALYRVSELSLTSDSPEGTYAAVLDEVAAVMAVPVVLLEQLDRAADRLVLLAARGVPAERGMPEIPLHQTPAGVAVQTGRPLVDRDPRTRRDLVHEAVRGLEPRLWASFPLMAGGAVAGTLTLVDWEPRNVDERWTELGQSLATAIAAYMERLDAEEALRESEGRYRALATQLGQANQELESFAYSVSHDLRAPLRTMQGFAHALLQNFGDAIPPEATDYVRRIISSGRQSERLISDLLAYSRLSFEKIEVKPVELDAVVAQALEQLHGDVAESGAQVSVARGLPTVLGNQTALVQVVANLVSNAVKFVPRETAPKVRIRAEVRGELVRLWVEDNGIGIPEGQDERIFRVFERLSLGEDKPGTGIGLAIVRRGMERIGGRSGVERRPEGGSAFWIEAQKERRKARRPWIRRDRKS
jgi:signal transduction histidine kinase/FixJ family two-component response regulator